MPKELQKLEAAKARSSRPHNWSKTAYLLAWIGLSMKWCSEVDSGSSSTASLAYFFIPIWAAVAALPFALLGYLLGGIRRKVDGSEVVPEDEKKE